MNLTQVQYDFEPKKGFEQMIVFEEIYGTTKKFSIGISYDKECFYVFKNKILGSLSFMKLKQNVYSDYHIIYFNNNKECFDYLDSLTINKFKKDVLNEKNSTSIFI